LEEVRAMDTGNRDSEERISEPGSLESLVGNNQRDVSHAKGYTAHFAAEEEEEAMVQEPEPAHAEKLVKVAVKT
jgi:hypothetical protein